jgi:hypothetical protein
MWLTSSPWLGGAESLYALADAPEPAGRCQRQQGGLAVWVWGGTVVSTWVT